MRYINNYPLWLKILLFGGLYYLLMVVGYEFYYSPENVAMFWPASGLFMSVLLLSKQRNWVWYFLVVLLCQVWVDHIYYNRVWYLGILFGMANSLEAFAGTIFIKKYFEASMETFTFRFLFATIGVGALFSPVFSATAGSFIIIYAYGADISSYWSIWSVWWSADFLGILMVVPTILAWQSINPVYYSRTTDKKKVLELTALILGLLVVQQHVFGSTFTEIDSFYDLPYILIPFLLWITFRFSPRTTTAIILTLVFLIVWHTDQGRGIFVFLSHTPNEVIVSLQAFLSIITISMLYLIALVSELRKSQNELEQLNQELEQHVMVRTKQLSDANRELNAFSYSVSHDLQAPVRAIVGFSDILKQNFQDSLPGEAVDYLDRIINSAYKMQNIILSLLSLSRISRKELEIRPVNIAELVRKVFSEYLAMQPDKTRDAIEFQVQDCGMVEADTHILEIALQNLISNAMKFSSPERQLNLSFGCVEGEDPKIFYIRDNGIGMDMEYHTKIFEPFQRLHGDLKYEGTGIGLSIVQRIIRRHGGDIWVESKLDEGSTFYFTVVPEDGQLLAKG